MDINNILNKIENYKARKPKRRETRNRHRESKSVERKIPTTLVPKGKEKRVKRLTNKKK